MAADFDPKKMSAISSINVTPFVDVCLVLLIIFMVTAPLMNQQVLGLKLPKAVSNDAPPIDQLGVAITKTGQVLLNGQLSTWEELDKTIQEIKQTKPNTQVVISADQDARHGDVVRVVDKIKNSGIESFALQIEKQ